MSWTDLSGAFGYGTKLTSAQMQNLRDNITALANGDSGAPKVQTAAIANAAVTSGKMAYNAGEVTVISGGGAHHYEVLGADGTWRRCTDDYVTG